MVFAIKNVIRFVQVSIICLSCQIATSQHEHSPSPTPQNGLLAEYYDGHEFDRFVTAKYVNQINDTWYDSPPVEGVDAHDCSIRWTGKLRPAKSGTYYFSAFVDDGIRVWIDGQIIIDQWNLNDVGIFEGSANLIAGVAYDFKVEYFNALLEGEINLLWDIEKPKKDQSWYESVFGTSRNFTTVPASVFLIPDKPIADLDTNESPTERQLEDPVFKENSTVAPTPTKDIQPIHNEPNAPLVKEKMTIAKAKKYIPQNIEFVRTKAEILPSSKDKLMTFARFMIDNPAVTVTIEGHTDVAGDAGQNLFLSERRANTVARLLVKEGILGKRIKTKGYGETRPLKTPAKGENYAPNRRVVFILDGLPSD